MKTVEQATVAGNILNTEAAQLIAMEGGEDDQLEPKPRVTISDSIEALDPLRIYEGQRPTKDQHPKISRALHRTSRGLCRQKLLQRGRSVRKWVDESSGVRLAAEWGKRSWQGGVGVYGGWGFSITFLIVALSLEARQFFLGLTGVFCV